MQDLGGDAVVGVGGPSSVLAGVGGANSAKTELGPPDATGLGTPCARSWTPDWIAVVEAKEQSLDRPICGARLMSGNPCTLVSNHASGRCRFHGGFDLTGAPEGNRNAVLHNLYSRRLMPCGSHCPIWQSCPLGGGAKDQGTSIIKLDPADRPTCPYEQTEYNTAVSDALQRVPDDRTRAYARHIAHQLALAQVMVTRAGLALREAEFTKPTVITGEKYHMTTPKVSPALTAYERLERAWRRLLIDFHRLCPPRRALPVEEQPYKDRTESDTHLDPDAQTKHYQSMPRPSAKEFYSRTKKVPEPAKTTQEAAGAGGLLANEKDTRSTPPAQATDTPDPIDAQPALADARSP